MRWLKINAITLATTDMARSCAFYEALGLKRTFGGGDDAPFTTLSSFVGDARQAMHVNLYRDESTERRGGWGRWVVYVDDVDAMHARALAAGITPEFAPSDASWGERHFHVRDPMGHEVSFATPIQGHPRWEGYVLPGGGSAL